MPPRAPRPATGPHDEASARSLSRRAAARIRARSPDALAAHYEFESARPPHDRRICRRHGRRASPAAFIEFRGNRSPGRRLRNESAEPPHAKRWEFVARVPRNYNAESLTLSPAATPGIAAAVIQGPLFRAGVRGQALFFDETNRGFMGRDVGYYDRERSIHARFLVLRRRGLRQRAGHQSSRREELRPHGLPPHDPRRPTMGLARKVAAREHDRDRDRGPLPVGEWTHIALTYDGRSRATGLKLYLNGTSR